MSNPTLEFAQFIDDAINKHATDPEYRARMEGERPNSAGPTGVCPGSHKHAETRTCYEQHGCKCTDCRTAMTARARKRRYAQARAQWADKGVKAA